MKAFPLSLIVATVLCSLVAGFLFAFAVVVMPGIKSLGDREFVRAFQVIDRVIQNNQPVFMLVWVGSVVALAAAAGLGFGQLDRDGRLLLIGALVVYALGVQLPTIAVNVPLNNRLQAVDADAADAAALKSAREAFEGRWNAWNAVRTLLSCLVAVGLTVVVFRL